MTFPDDHVDDMYDLDDESLSDAAIEAFIAGVPDPEWDQTEPLVTLAEHMAVAVGGPPPAPSHDLLRMFWGSPAKDATAEVTSRRPVLANRRGAVAPAPERAPRLPWARRVGVAVGLALGVGAASVGVGVAGATGSLPPPVQRVVARAVEAVTPFEVPSPPGSRSGRTSGAGAAEVVTGESAVVTAGVVSGGGGLPSGIGTASEAGPGSRPGQSGAASDGHGPGGTGPGATGPGGTGPGGSGSSGSGPGSGPGSTGLDRAGQTPAGDNGKGGPGSSGGGPSGTPTGPPASGPGRAGDTPAATAVPPSGPGRSNSGAPGQSSGPPSGQAAGNSGSSRPG